MKKQLYVVCVYKSGGEYTKEYVDRLYEGVTSHYDGQFMFICLTDVMDEFPEENPYIVTDLQYDLPGWWSKLELFREDTSQHRIVYFDLDTIIKGDISKLLNDSHTFTTLDDFNPKVNRLASGIMAFEGDFTYLLETFNKDMIDLYTPRLGGKLGDQAYLEDFLQVKVEYIQDRYPGLVASYKWDDEETKRNASIICYHGRPRPHDTGWAVE